MQPVVTDKPYKFVAPYTSPFWIWLLHPIFPWYLRRKFGIQKIEFHGLEKLKASVSAGHGILIAPNHPRPSDPLVMGPLSMAVGQPFYFMAAWHVFYEGGWLQGAALRRFGGFSIHRWSLDREAIKTATSILAESKRPLVIFPEGHITRSNDHLAPLLEGTSFIARAAARQRVKLGRRGSVVVHPVALKYKFLGDVERSARIVLAEIEARLSWQPQEDLPLVERVMKVGQGLLALKEIEYLGHSQRGTIPSRLTGLIAAILTPLEDEWAGGKHDLTIAERAKRLRTAILPEMVNGEIDEAERARRWRHLGDVYVAQQLACYPPDYVASRPTPERILETVERFEEDLTDTARVHGPFHLSVTVGDAIEVPSGKEKVVGDDPVMVELERQLSAMIHPPGSEGGAPTARGAPASAPPQGAPPPGAPLPGELSRGDLPLGAMEGTASERRESADGN